MKYDTIESFGGHSNHVRYSIGIDYVQLALESCKTPDTCHNLRIIERKYSLGQKYLFELRRCSSYVASSNRELFMKIY